MTNLKRLLIAVLKLLLKPFVITLWVLRQVCYGINAAPGIIARSPVALYKKTKVWRDWVLAKVDYLETESAKWKRTFQIVRSPYSLLLKLGFSPQWAVGLLAVEQRLLQVQ